MSKYSKVEIEQFRKRKGEIIFKFMDKDRDGILSLKNFMTFPDELQRAGKTALADQLGKLYQGHWERIVQFAGKPLGTEQLNTHDFVKGYNSLVKTEWYINEFMAHIPDVYYDSIDRSHDGVVGHGEWKAYYKSRGIDDDDFVQWTFARMDTGKTGFISRQKFKYAFLQFGVGEDPDEDYSFLYKIKHPCLD